jgi:hypothetical protein
LNLCAVSDVWQTAIHTAEPPVPEMSVFEVEMTIGKVKRHFSLGGGQIPAELFKAGASEIGCEIHKPTNSVWNMEELQEQSEQSIIVPISKKDSKTDCSNYTGISVLSTMYKIFIQNLAIKANSICRGIYWGTSVWMVN